MVVDQASPGKNNYDMYGDEKASPRFDAGYSQDNDGYTYFQVVVVDQDMVRILSDLVNGRVRVGVEAPSHFRFPLVALVVQAHLDSLVLA